MGDSLEKDREAYRNVLLECDKSSVEEYDKAVMTLSGGAIGLSFAFLKEIGGSWTLVHTCFLLGAWVLWGLSISSVLFSHYCSHRAMRRALIDLNRNELNYERPGRCWDSAINILNPVGGALFFLGLMSLLVFVDCNVHSRSGAERLPAATRVGTTTTTMTSATENLHESSMVAKTNLARSP